MNYFKPGMIVRFPYDSDYYVIILKVLISERNRVRVGCSQSFCLVLTDEGPVKEVWLYEDLNKQLV